MLNYTIKKEKYFILVKQAGEDSYEVSLELWKEVAKACKKYQCFNILGISDTTPLKTMGAYDHHKIFDEAKITMKHRIAWVENNSKAIEMLLFAETVLKNRGRLNGKVFANVVEAKKWLMSIKGT